MYKSTQITAKKKLFLLIYIVIINIQQIRKSTFFLNIISSWPAYSSANILLWGLQSIAYLQFKCFCIMYFVEKLTSNISQPSFYQIRVYFRFSTYLLLGNKTICKLLLLYKTGLPYHAKNKICVPSQNITINLIIL